MLYFATLRDRAGLRQEPFELAPGATVADLKLAVIAAHPTLEPALDTSICSVNREFAEDDQVLKDGDETALFPPVSGGSQAGVTVFRITRDPIDMNVLLEKLILPTTGAACVFSGMVRGITERGESRTTEFLTYEAYEPMAEAKMAQVAGEIQERWPSVEGIAIVQRIGDLDPGTPTVLIACTAAHRDTGVFEAARYGIDRLKQIVPIWKKRSVPRAKCGLRGTIIPGPTIARDEHELAGLSALRLLELWAYLSANRISLPLYLRRDV